MILNTRQAAGGDRRNQLWGSLIVFLVITNVAVASRVYVHARTQHHARKRLYLEDMFALLSAVSRSPRTTLLKKLLITSKLCVNAVIGCLFACMFDLTPSCGCHVDLDRQPPTVDWACTPEPSTTMILISLETFRMLSRSAERRTASGCYQVQMLTESLSSSG